MSRIIARLSRLPTIAIDATAAAAVAAAVMVAIGAGLEPGAKDPDALAYLLAVAIAVPLLFWRRWPLGVLVVTAAMVMAYHSLAYPAIGIALPLAAALFTATFAGRLVPAVTLVAGLELLAFAYRDFGKGQGFIDVLGSQTIEESLLIAVVVLLAETLRSRRALVAEAAERERRARVEQKREAAELVREERLRIAREMHDVLAHSIAVIGVQAGVAAESLDDAPQAAEAALRTIRETSRKAMDEVRATVGVLRAEDGAPRAPAPSLTQLDGLVAMAASANVDVGLDVSGRTRPLPAVVDLAAYRIIQESLTNVVRHAGARSARISIRYEREGLIVQVDDDGSAGRAAVPNGGGHGIGGMRERAMAVGGRFDAGPAPFPATGFRVRAWLPTDGVSS